MRFLAGAIQSAARSGRFSVEAGTLGDHSCPANVLGCLVAIDADAQGGVLHS